MTSRLLHYPGTASQSLPSIRKIKEEFHLDEELFRTIQGFREKIINIVSKQTRKALFLVGPCSIHDTSATLEFARKLKTVSEYVSDKIMLVMRVYCEKPRTSTGWKGFLYDPDLNHTNDVAKGIRMTRELMLEINRIGIPVGTEFLDPLTCHYYQDLVSWGSIGARTSSSQIHRQLASGLPMPIGFKNSTDGDLLNAVNGMIAAKHSQRHIGLDEDGKACMITTSGNPNTHLVLRGGESKPNFDRPSVAYALELLATNELPLRLMIDCSHDNSRKDHELQEEVFNEVIEQITHGNDSIVGLALESHLEDGKQELGSSLKYGVSITDSCLGWKITEQLILRA
ncbi:MAG: Phospho-2-dehydro-3-deoxyheptonate aldolase, Tyr-sensitive, partial [Chlamydiae bacterium]|nr:Phospho-2-dehydro-3-deoxyheptonate aldolase, Tyr-sensitive [Chlamydiota bacterium]